MRRCASRAFRAMACFTAICVAASGFSGCSLVPEAFPLLTHEEKKALFTAVVRGVQCEIRRAVFDQLDSKDGERVAWLKYWSALINMQLTFDETLTFNPGVTLKTPNLLDATVWLANGSPRGVPQDYSFGLGGRIEGARSRNETIEYFWPFDNFLGPNRREEPAAPCYHAGPISIVGDLKLGAWLDDVLDPIKKCAFIGYPGVPGQIMTFGLAGATEPDESSCDKEDVLRQGLGKDNPIKIFQHRVKFRLALEAGASPTWNLARISSPLNGPLVRGQREDTGELLITLGSAYTKDEIARKEKGLLVQAAPRPSPEMRFGQNSLQIGAAVGDEFRR